LGREAALMKEKRRLREKTAQLRLGEVMTPNNQKEVV
jgi:hypothetical protein